MNALMRMALVTAGAVLLAACAAPAPDGDTTALGAEGYDVVAYFTDGEAVPGSPAHTVAWHGLEWRFASAEHRRLFRDDPERYAPAYDGYCAWAMSRGQLAQGRAQHWAIHDDRLFLNCNAKVHRIWLDNRERMIESADREWAERSGG